MAADDGWKTLITCCPVCKQGYYYWKHPGGSQASAQAVCPAQGYIVQINNNQIRCDGCKDTVTYQAWKWKCNNHDFASMGNWHIHPVKCGACVQAFGNNAAPFHTFKGLKKNCTVCNKTAPKKHDGGRCAGVRKLVQDMKVEMLKKKSNNNYDEKKQEMIKKSKINNIETQKKSEKRYPKAKYDPKNRPDLNTDHVAKTQLPKAKIHIPSDILIGAVGGAIARHFGEIDIRELPKEPPKQYVGLPATELIRQRPIQKLKNPYVARRTIKTRKIRPAPKQYNKMMNKIKSLPINNIPVESLKKSVMPIIIERLKNLDLAMSMDEHNKVFEIIKNIANHNKLNNDDPLKLELIEYAEIFKTKYPNIHSLPNVDWEESKINEVPKDVLQKNADTRFNHVANRYSQLSTNDVRNMNNGKLLAWKLYKRNKCSKILSPKELGYTEVSPGNDKFKKSYKHTLQAKAKSGEITINAINMGQGSFSTRIVLTNNTNKFQFIFVPPGTQFAQKDFS